MSDSYILGDFKIFPLFLHFVLLLSILFLLWLFFIGPPQSLENTSPDLSAGDLFGFKLKAKYYRSSAASEGFV